MNARIYAEITRTAACCMEDLYVAELMSWHLNRGVPDKMSIILIRGPEQIASGAGSSRRCVPRQVVSQLVQHAAMAGKTIALRTCETELELVSCLRHANDAEFLLLDPGNCSCDTIREELERLTVPYIEVHDDDFGALESPLAPACGRPLKVIQGRGSQSYAVALSIALDHLGCAECENNYHVGT